MSRHCVQRGPDNFQRSLTAKGVCGLLVARKVTNKLWGNGKKVYLGLRGPVAREATRELKSRCSACCRSPVRNARARWRRLGEIVTRYKSHGSCIEPGRDRETTHCNPTATSPAKPTLSSTTQSSKILHRSKQLLNKNLHRIDEQNHNFLERLPFNLHKKSSQCVLYDDCCERLDVTAFDRPFT